MIPGIGYCAKIRVLIGGTHRKFIAIELTDTNHPSLSQAFNHRGIKRTHIVGKHARTRRRAPMSGDKNIFMRKRNTEQGMIIACSKTLIGSLCLLDTSFGQDIDKSVELTLTDARERLLVSCSLDVSPRRKAFASARRRLFSLILGSLNHPGNQVKPVSDQRSRGLQVRALIRFAGKVVAQTQQRVVGWDIGITDWVSTDCRLSIRPITALSLAWTGPNSLAGMAKRARRARRRMSSSVKCMMPRF